jgi:hypothetical protein
MKKLTLKIITIGHIPADINIDKIKSYKSDLFEIDKDIDSLALRTNTDTGDWGYTDKNISTQLPKIGSEDILVVLVGIPLEDNYYTRRLKNNVVVLSFHETSNYLRFKNIPLENIVLRLLYAYSFVYHRFNGEIPKTEDYSNFTHDETRGCIYDMNGLKDDIVFSCHRPIICSECTERMLKDQISLTTINTAKNELTNIKKQLFYLITEWIKVHPIITVFISSFWALLLSSLGSIIANSLL